MHAINGERKPNKPSLIVINTQQDKSAQSTKVVDLIRTRTRTKERFYSIEVSHSGSLLLNFNDFLVQPLFTSVTWFRDNLEAENDSVEPSVRLMNAIKSTPTLLHLTCYQLTEEKIEKLLKMKLTNVLALRGDEVTPNPIFRHSIDLVRRIKHTSGNTSLAVAGYPEQHPESISMEMDLKYLRDKVDAGADFIITQTCFSSAKIKEFIRNCRDVGIRVAIVPGIFVPSTFNSLLAMCRICKIRVPTEEFQMYKMLKDDSKTFQHYAVQSTVRLLNDLLHKDDDEAAAAVGVHFFTLNNFAMIHRVIANFDFK
ncbi:methylenetetrahydrofolate reductase [Bradysia coprophila]|uniref:methylenetetrahydrofolate reductase n=1 Tax=Bradysia coprophila TaxID=38358 RepID=UPI00187D80C0|nr:methylenetetrahydrofolate reductase [Bradysia coprophila]